MPHSRLSAWLAAGLLVALMLPSPAGAASEDGQFRVKGIGIETCKEYAQDFADRSQRMALYGSWLAGYVSAINRHRRQTFDAMPWQSVEVLLVFIRNHCAANPELHFAEVANAMIGFFENQSLGEVSPEVEAVAGEHKVVLYEEVLRRAQQALTLAGVYEGAADGVYGPKTKAALEAFQDDRDLPKTGVPDQRTLIELFTNATGN